MALVDTLNVGTCNAGIANINTINPAGGPLSVGGTVSLENTLEVYGASTLAGVTATTGDFTTSITSPDILGSLDKTINTNGLSIFNVKSYGATGNGTTDDTAAINAAIAAAVAAGGGTVYFPEGNYLCAQTQTVGSSSASLVIGGNGVSFLGAGSLVTQITFGATVPIGITWTQNPSTQTTFQNIKFQTASETTNVTTCIHTNGTEQTFIKIIDCYFLRYLTAMTFDSGSFDIWLTRVTIGTANQSSSQGVNLANCGEVHITDGVFGAHTTACGPMLTLTNASAIYVQNTDMVGNFVASNTVLINPGSGDSVYSVFFSNVLFDSGNESSLQLSPTAAGKIYTCSFTGCWFSGSANSSGTQFAPDTTTATLIEDLRFTGCTWVNNVNVGLGMSVNTHGSETVTGIAFQGCSFIGNGNYGAIIENGVSNVMFTGCFFGNVAAWTGHSQAYGAAITSTVGSGVVLTGNTFSGNSSAALNLTATNAVITNNPGYNPVGILTAPTVGASPWTYTNTTCVPVMLWLAGGTITGFAYDGKAISPYATGGYYLGPGMSVTVTYTSAPTAQMLLGF